MKRHPFQLNVPAIICVFTQSKRFIKTCQHTLEIPLAPTVEMSGLCDGLAGTLSRGGSTRFRQRRLFNRSVLAQPGVADVR
jgi:hypothetical protein